MCGDHLFRDGFFFKALHLVFQCPHHYMAWNTLKPCNNIEYCALLSNSQKTCISSAISTAKFINTTIKNTKNWWVLIFFFFLNLFILLLLFFLLLIYTSSVDVLLEFTRVQGLKINICLFIFVTCNMRQPYRTFVLPVKMSRMENP